MDVSEEGRIIHHRLLYLSVWEGTSPFRPAQPQPPSPPKQQTKEQLGYIVFGGLHLLWNKSMVGGLHFRVLSKTHGPEVRLNECVCMYVCICDNNHTRIYTSTNNPTPPHPTIQPNQTQTPNPTQEILERVEAFLPRFRDEVLAPLTPEALGKHKASLVTQLLDPPKTLVGEVCCGGCGLGGGVGGVVCWCARGGGVGRASILGVCGCG